VLHIPLKTNSRGYHVPVFCNVAHMFVCPTLQVGEIGAMVAIRASKPTLSTVRGVGAVATTAVVTAVGVSAPS
jgi:hypothetical protein